jgi:hypothetical protein
MGIPEGIFDALYERFLLRDIFGKDLPGLTLFACIGLAADGGHHC